MKLDAVKLGLTLGIVWAASVLAFAITSSTLNWGTGLLNSLGTLYIGLKATPTGVVIGMIWAFLDAGIGGWIIASVYNLLVGKK